MAELVLSMQDVLGLVPSTPVHQKRIRRRKAGQSRSCQEPRRAELGQEAYSGRAGFMEEVRMELDLGE